MDFIDGIGTKVDKPGEVDYEPQDYQFSDGEGVEEADLLGDSGSDQAWSDDEESPIANRKTASKKVTFAKEDSGSDYDDEESEDGEDGSDEEGEADEYGDEEMEEGGEEDFEEEHEEEQGDSDGESEEPEEDIDEDAEYE